MWTNALFGVSVLGGLLLAPVASLDSADSAPGAIVVRNEYWAKAGMEEQVYLHRLHASEVRARLGLYQGRILRRISNSDEQPDVVWECRYPSLEARDADVQALRETGEFEPVLEKMGTLIEKFDRSVWRLERLDQPSLASSTSNRNTQEPVP